MSYRKILSYNGHPLVSDIYLLNGNFVNKEG